MLESFFNKDVKSCEISKNTYFEEHLPSTASDCTYQNSSIRFAFVLDRAASLYLRTSC